MSINETIKLLYTQVIPVILLIVLLGWFTYYLFENILGIDVNANIISIIFVIIGAGYLGRVIKQASGKNS